MTKQITKQFPKAASTHMKSFQKPLEPSLEKYGQPHNLGTILAAFRKPFLSAREAFYIL
jgi:hypothetical protein